MHADERQSLIDKIEALPPEARERGEGYVEALLEVQATHMDFHSDRPPETTPSESEFPKANIRISEEDEPSAEGSSEKERSVPRFQWRGALSHLADEYTAEELQEKANEWRMKKALDY